MFNLDDFKQFIPLDRDEDGLIWGTTTKAIGDGRKPEVIQLFIKGLPSAPKVTVRLTQTHGTDIHIVEDVSKANPDGIIDAGEGDGLITNVPGILLTVLTADCVPIVFIDRVQKVVGISHQGWKGTLARMAQLMVKRMLENGAQLESLECFIGPAIGRENYDVPEERYKQFKYEFYTIQHLVSSVKDGKFYLDLGELNAQQLLESGVPFANVQNCNRDTFTESDLFFSYRRDEKEAFGEMISYVMVK